MSIAPIGKRAGAFCRLSISCELRVTGCELGVASWGLRVGGCGLERLRSFRFNPGDEVRDLQSTVPGDDRRILRMKSVFASV
jgi:hypothetical protein